jgi:Family of unknown function (DUF5329)
MKKLLAVFALFVSFSASAEVSANAKQEISYLFTHLKSSGCEFNRNGSWYKADAAADHLNQKYEYLLKKGYISTSEDFIARAASESSMSHKAYIVKCGGTETKSATWFKDVLTKYRNEAAAKTP